jgi:peptidoglycan L-alanyl-D-glutamate endopeptidase CwlK
MPADLFQRVNLDQLYMPFVQKVLGVAAACRARGADYWATLALRDYAFQERLYKAHLAGGPRAAPPGLSAHQYGLAVDFTRDLDAHAAGIQPDWSHEDYLILGEETERVGLVWGNHFGDAPHVQWPGYVSGAQLDPLRRIWVSCPSDASDYQRLATVWKHIETKG